MKRTFILLTILSFFLNLSAQEKPTTVQGIPYDFGNFSPGNRKPKETKVRSSSVFTFEDIKFWVGEGSNRAALVVDWYYSGETAMVWGYRWNGSTTGLDMIQAIAAADPDFLLLTQRTNLGNTIAGIGYAAPRTNITLAYDLEGAKSDSRISFGFDEPNPMLGQTHCPANPLSEINAAIQSGITSGIIDHPFNYVNYGYACYDYDYWECTSSGVKWRSAWYEGYWSYLTKDHISEDYSYSGIGATLRVLSDGSWDSWGFQDGWDSWSGVEPREPFTAALPSVINVTGITLNENSAHLFTGETFSLRATISPANATDQTISWTSSDHRILTVSDGIVSAVSAGTAIVTAITQDGNFRTTCTVTVTDPVIHVTGVALNRTSVHLNPGQSYPLKAIIAPENASNQKISWSNSDESVATIDANGEINAISAGITTITVTTEDGNFSDACLVEIKENTTIANEHIEGTDIQVYIRNSRLFINTPQAEIIRIYTLNGQLIFSEKKDAGEAEPDINDPEQLLIIRGSSGWTRKITKY